MVDLPPIPRPPMIIRVVDVETAGYEDVQPNDLIELGWCDMVWNNGSFEITPPSSVLVRPSRPITSEGRSVHHIRDDEIANSLSREEALDLFFKLPPARAFAAHNNSYELSVLPELHDWPWVCTYKCSTRLHPTTRRHTNQFLRYELGLTPDPQLAFPPHRAGPDAYTTAFLLQNLLQMESLAALIQLTREGVYLPTITFGKPHRGKKWSDPTVDDGYLQFVVEKSSLSDDIKANARREIERRRSVQSGAPAATTTQAHMASEAPQAPGNRTPSTSAVHTNLTDDEIRGRAIRALSTATRPAIFR